MRRSGLKNLALYGLLFILYFVSAWFGLKVHAVNNFATLIWIPTGLSLAYLFLFGVRYWPSVFAGALVANYITGAPLLAAFSIGIGNTLEALFAVYILKHSVKFEPALNRVSDVLGLIVFAGMLSTTISATTGVSSLLITGTIHTSDYGITWLSWWSGDAISNLVIAPLIFVWSTPFKEKFNMVYLAGLLFVMAVIVGVAMIIFGPLGSQLGDGRPITYLIFPPIIFLALRFGQRATVSAVFLLSAIGIWQTNHGQGQFALGDPSINLLFASVYIGVVAIIGLIVAATVSEQKLHERKKDEFISVASHELKTPITSLKTLVQTAETLLTRKGDKKTSELLVRADKQIDRLNHLVLKLLDVSRIQEGRVALQKSRFNLTELILEIADEAQVVGGQKIIVSSVNDLRVNADRDRIGRVLSNLLSNAIKYSSPRSEIMIKTAKRPDSVLISVRDFGKGIAKEDRSKIFDRYYQSNKNDHTKDYSLGLGLYISKEIVELHGGRIWVKSNENGSTFYFTIPRGKQ